MKTAVSIPDPLFQSAEKLARRMGLSRSAFYATAVSTFLDQHGYEGITRKLNEVYADDSKISEVDKVVYALQLASLPKDKW